MGLKSWFIVELPSKGKLHLSRKGNCRMHAIFLITLLMIMISFGLSTAVYEYPEIVKEHILNYLDYNLKRGYEIGMLSATFTLDSYDILEVEIPNRTQVIEILNNMQSNEGTWATGQVTYVPATSIVLMFYNRSGVKPAKSLEPFFSTIDTWEKVNAHVNTYNPGNYWGGLWGYVNCYVVYKGESPPWTNEFVDEANEKFDTWAYNNHQRTHLMPNLLQLRKPIPRLDEAINITLQQQKEDGSWDWSEAETVFSIQLLRHIKNDTTICTNLIDSAINRGLEYVRKCYRTIEFEGKTYAGFAINSSAQTPEPRETAEGIWALLNPESDVWSRWFVACSLYTFNVPWHGLNHTIILVGNSTITNFNFNHSLRQVSFNVTTFPPATGYCNISIPKTFMWCDSPSQWNVTVDGSHINDFTVIENSTHTFIYLMFNYITKTVAIQGTYVMQVHNLTITSTEGGTTVPAPGIYDYVVGTLVQVTAIPDLGYSFNYWLLAGEVRTDNPISINMDANHTLQTFFIDDIPPEIDEPVQEPSENVTAYQNVTVTVFVIDMGTGVHNATLWYNINATMWRPLNMTKVAVNSYQATIPGYEYATWVTYKIIAYDNNENRAINDNHGHYYVYHVIPEFPSAIILLFFMIIIILPCVVFAKKRLPRENPDT